MTEMFDDAVFAAPWPPEGVVFVATPIRGWCEVVPEGITLSEALTRVREAYVVEYDGRYYTRLMKYDDSDSWVPEGVCAMNNPAPLGWVEIQKDDDGDLPSDHAAAVAVRGSCVITLVGAQNIVRITHGAVVRESQELLAILTAAARAAHEANRSYCLWLRDHSQPHWESAPDWQKESAISGARLIYHNPDTTPRKSHENWLKDKTAEGWVYGPVKCAIDKTHPCMVPYDALPPAQRAKDSIFGAVVRAVLAACREA